MHYKTPITDVQIEANFEHAAEQYAAFGVDIERAVDRALEVPILAPLLAGRRCGGF